MNEEETKPTPSEPFDIESDALKKKETAETEGQSKAATADPIEKSVEAPAESEQEEPEEDIPVKTVPLRLALLIMSLLLATSILITYTLTAASWRKTYVEGIREQQAIIDSFKESLSDTAINMQVLESVLLQSSYYADNLDGKAMMEAAFNAYVSASGDRYATYYTEEEYQKILEENNAAHCGIGVSVLESQISIESQTRKAFHIVEIYPNSPASLVDLKVGDYIYAVKQEGAMLTVEELGYDGARAAIRGEKDTAITLEIYRVSDGAQTPSTVELIRKPYESTSVSGKRADGHPEIGIVRISAFDLKTPLQLRQTVDGMLGDGVTAFIFDLRGNPGGDLQSIKAVMSYFLKEGDLVLESIDKNGSVSTSYRVEPTSFSGDYALCSVSKEEIGMYSQLNMVVLCNENTASAAEVFTATMQDYQLAPVVGTKTFGKGIMQSTRRVIFKDFVGYIKLTTYAYKTNRAESYHGIGVQPDVVAELDASAKKIPLIILPQAQDAQLQAAIHALQG